MGRKAVDLTGQRFGRLTVLDRAGQLNSSASWRCVCDCGEHHVARSNNLRAGHVTRCPKCARFKRMVRAQPHAAAGIARPRVTVVQLWCTETGQRGGFVRALDSEQAVVARTHFTRLNMRIRPNVVSTKMVIRLLEFMALHDLIRPRNLGETLTHWLKAQQIELQPMWFTPAESVSLAWFESAHAPVVQLPAKAP